MTQYKYEPLSPADSGLTLLERLNGVVPALLTNHKGAVRPGYVQPGMLWIDDSGSTWLLKVFDGTADATLAAVDPATHAVVDVFLRLDGSQSLTIAQRAALRAVLDVSSAETVGTKAPKRNRNLNPAFQVCQDRAAGATVVLASSGYAFDGVTHYIVGGGALTCSQVAKTSPGGSPFRYRCAVSTTDASIAPSDLYLIAFPIEGLDVADLMFGTAAAKLFTWRGVFNGPAGTYGLSFCNGSSARSYVVPFTISAEQANTDVMITAVVPGDVAGTWVNDASGVGLWVRICLASGTSFQAPNAGAWQSGNFATVASQTNGISSTANVFEVSDIGLYDGSEIPVWEMPSYADDLARCRRYFLSIGGEVIGQRFAIGTMTSATSAVVASPLPVKMRTIPSVSLNNVSYFLVEGTAGGVISSVISTADTTSDYLALSLTTAVGSGLTAGQGVLFRANNTLSARILLNSRL